MTDDDDQKIHVAKHRLELHVTEMSTTRMKWGEPHLTIWVNGPRGGFRDMIRIDRVAADRLLRSLARACAALEEAANAALYASNFRRRSLEAKKPRRKRSAKKSSPLH